jgi:hypothetical protein
MRLATKEAGKSAKQSPRFSYGPFRCNDVAGIENERGVQPFCCAEIGFRNDFDYGIEVCMERERAANPSFCAESAEQETRK